MPGDDEDYDQFRAESKERIRTALEAHVADGHDVIGELVEMVHEMVSTGGEVWAGSPDVERGCPMAIELFKQESANMVLNYWRRVVR